MLHANACLAGCVHVQMNLEMWLLTASEADRNPVGEAQAEPNVDPFLPDPARNPPPWAVGTRGLDWLAKRKTLVLCIALCLIILPIVIPVLVVQLKSAI